DDGFFGVVVERLADDEDGFAVAVTVGVGEGDVGGEGDVAGHALEEIAELVAGVPDVIAGGVDGVGVGGGVEAGAGGDEGAADVGLAGEDADGCVEDARWAMEVGWWSDLLMRGAAGVGPGGDF